MILLQNKATYAPSAAKFTRQRYLFTLLKAYTQINYIHQAYCINATCKFKEIELIEKDTQIIDNQRAVDRGTKKTYIYI